jgi:RNAse (barnase) inhibitor barstar
MTTKNACKLLNDQSKPIYIFQQKDILKELEAFDQENLDVQIIPGDRINNKGDLLRHISDILSFPDYFGLNWDALVDCLRGMDWTSSECHIIVFSSADRFLKNYPSDFWTFLDIITNRSKEWIKEGVVLRLFVGVDDTSQIEKFEYDKQSIRIYKK